MPDWMDHFYVGWVAAVTVLGIVHHFHIGRIYKRSKERSDRYRDEIEQNYEKFMLKVDRDTIAFYRSLETHCDVCGPVFREHADRRERELSNQMCLSEAGWWLFHKWGKWEIVHGKVWGSAATAQMRHCVRCNRMELDWL